MNTGTTGSTANTTVNTTGNTAGNNPNSFTEYKLKMSPMAVSHNVMVLNSSTAKLSDFTQPVRMFRDKNSALIQEAPAKLAQPEGTGRIAVGGGSITAPGSRPSFKKKTKIFFQGDEEEFDEKVREVEAVPWLLEDYDAQHSFVGRLEGGQSSNYVFFVNQGDEFRIIPVNKWYRFQSKLSYHTLSLEEAESQMAARKKDDVSRWLMKNRTLSQRASEEDVSGGSSTQKLAEKVLNGESAQRKRQAQVLRSRIEDSQRGEELDFDELFDDDEGNDNFGGLLDDLLQADDPKDADNAKKSNYKLSTEGRAMKKIVRHLDKSNDVIYASDDENDPYASDYEGEDEDEDDFDKWSREKERDQKEKDQKEATQAVVNNINSASVKGVKPVAASSTSRSTASSKASSLSGSLTSSKAASPPGSPSKRPPVKRSKTSDDEDSSASIPVITESEIIGYLKQGPISTKELIAKFKRQLKADAKNKEIFRELVRKLAMVRAAGTGVAGEEDKLLELKPEFRN